MMGGSHFSLYRKCLRTNREGRRGEDRTKEIDEEERRERGEGRGEEYRERVDTGEETASTQARRQHRGQDLPSEEAGCKKGCTTTQLRR